MFIFLYTVKVWNSSWELVCTFVGHCGAITVLAPYPYGPMVVSGSSDATIRVWNLVTHDQIEMYVRYRIMFTGILSILYIQVASITIDTVWIIQSQWRVSPVSQVPIVFSLIPLGK